MLTFVRMPAGFPLALAGTRRGLNIYHFIDVARRPGDATAVFILLAAQRRLTSSPGALVPDG